MPFQNRLFHSVELFALYLQRSKGRRLVIGGKADSKYDSGSSSIHRYGVTWHCIQDTRCKVALLTQEALEMSEPEGIQVRARRERGAR